MAAPLPRVVAEFTEGGFTAVDPDRTFWRYYFAGQALGGALSDSGPWKEGLRRGMTTQQFPAVAGIAVRLADALLAELESVEAP